MRTERRCIPRKRPGAISYFEFEAGSGGIVLDASEKGLAFQAADAVEQLGPSRMFISPHPEERIELSGDVVWTDRTKRTGGLRFVDLGADSCNRIRGRRIRCLPPQCHECRIFLVAAPTWIAARSHRYQCKSVDRGRSSPAWPPFCCPS